ncbi:hypothetical protein LEP1GSC137_1327 [Leptospira borgpetersenii str. Noumea 25]|nr:hypothetical protein LEP1GSC137_1327 [Leptospira borgpetersenii str. Noumea 25]
MLFSNELNYWVIKKMRKIFTAPDGGAISEPVCKTSKMWELPRKLDNNKTYSKADDRQRGEDFSFYEKFKMNISVEVLRPVLTPFVNFKISRQTIFDEKTNIDGRKNSKSLQMETKLKKIQFQTLANLLSNISMI